MALYFTMVPQKSMGGYAIVMFGDGLPSTQVQEIPGLAASGDS